MLTNRMQTSSRDRLRSRRVAVLAAASGLFACLALAQATPDAPAANGGPVEPQPNAPSSHTVVKGDTLWGISGKFLKTPWRWPEVWRLNKAQIRDPHWIYPGQVVVFDPNAVGGPRLSILQPGQAGPNGIVRLSPQIRAEARGEQAIPTIPTDDIEPFLLRNRVIGAETFADAPQVVKSVGERVAFSRSDAIFAVGIKPTMGKVFHLFRKGRELRDPAVEPRPWYRWHHATPDPQIIGYEATYLGDARLLRDGDVARLEIVTSRQEVQVGDYLIPAPPVETMAWVPRAPEAKIEGQVMTLPNGISEASKTSVVTLNVGKRHGLEVGHVLAVFKPTETFANPRYKESPMNWVPGWPKSPGAEPATLQVPEERIGLVFVFNVFDGVAYAMVMNTGVENVRAGYLVRNP